MMMRHNKQVRVGDRTFKLDTKGDSGWYVLRDEKGEPVARQARVPAGRVFQQSWSNPDHEGRETYPLELFERDRPPAGWNSYWRNYDPQAGKGDLLSERFLTRLVTYL